jgi:hypothetical protein
MMKYKIIYALLWFGLCFTSFSQEQSQEATELKFKLNDDGSHYVKGTLLNQVWLRNTDMNPGTTINGYPKNNYTDLSIRRLRFQIIAQLTDKIFFYAQFGQNNFNFQSTKFTGAFFHDAIVEYAVLGQKLSIGGGLTGWSGLARYASPSIGSILTLDAPLYQQATNGVNDQFLRKLSVYAKGQVGKIGYRVALSNPMTVTGAQTTATNPNNADFSFSNEPAKMQMQGYVQYMFKDIESNLTPYTTGTYLGKKRVFNVGAGILYQPQAMWALSGGQTIHKDMILAAVDIFYDAPLNENSAVTAYGAFSNYDFGEGYLRNIGVNNPANGISGPYPSGSGNSFSMIGTGATFYGQVGYLFGKNILTDDGKLQPFAAVQVSDYDVLHNPMTMLEGGLNYFINGSHNSKLSLVYQNRPTYVAIAGENYVDTRKGMAILQYQIAF